jgi:putative ABC transport system substrate-binding protein
LTSQSASGIAGKRLQLLKETVPGVSRVAALWNPGNTAKAIEFKETAAAAEALGLALHSLEVRGPSDFPGAFAAAAAGHVEGLATFTDPLTHAHATPIADFARTNRLPSVFEVRPFVDAGGLMAYGPDALDLYRRAAGYVDKILKGAKPAELPVEQPTKWECVINLATARALGLTIPPSVLARATDVIQ